jgi:protein involved in ribonucleotide reduction
LSISIAYFSNYSGNTKRFVEKLNDGFNVTYRIPINWDSSSPLVIPSDFVLFIPTYGGGSESSAVPRQVKRFLNISQNRNNLRGIVGFGNTNFGEHFCKAANVVSKKTGVPVIARVEIFGTEDDVIKVQERMRMLYDNE